MPLVTRMKCSVQIFYDESASGYIDGIALHWYFDEVCFAKRLTQTHERHPNKFILATEVPFPTLPLLIDYLYFSQKSESVLA